MPVIFALLQHGRGSCRQISRSCLNFFQGKYTPNFEEVKPTHIEVDRQAQQRR